MPVHVDVRWESVAKLSREIDRLKTELAEELNERAMELISKLIHAKIQHTFESIAQIQHGIKLTGELKDG